VEQAEVAVVEALEVAFPQLGQRSSGTGWEKERKRTLSGGERVRESVKAD